MNQQHLPEVTVQELVELKAQNANFQLIDVRERNEFDICNLGGHLIPLAQLPQRLDELDPAKLIIVHCKSGGRSSRAVEFLLGNGFSNVKNLKGGVTAWRNEIDPSLPV